MPSGTSSYIIAQGHTVLCMKTAPNGGWLIRYARSASGSVALTVTTGEVIWDISSTYTTAKFSTGGNEFVNFVSSIEDMDSDETDYQSNLYWNGEVSLN